jgi:RimJ/RimL family protein N-acetyltransferase
MSTILNTERLLLKEFEISDAAFIVELVNTPGWIKFIGDRNIKTIEQAENYLKNGPLKSYQENGYGLYKVEEKMHRIPIGMCGIIKREVMNYPDIGFAFLPDYNNKGYAFEIASATLIFAKKHLHLNIISAITVPYNERSVKLIKKLGLSFHKKILLPGSNEEVELYDNDPARNINETDAIKN